MPMENNQKRSPLYKSFGYAFEGIFNTIKDERNIKIHLIVTTLVIIFGFILKISLTEWFVCILLFAIIIPLELINTAIEAVVDLASKEYAPLAKKAKDAAAGAVLVAAILSAVIGSIIFFPKLYYFIIGLFN
ncbi:diacylglycerol kinase family protein [Butyrivibrio fibrisolvens]|uniref:diacylglycerol kinase family protein n=1 Tax=Butyrivibrio fibrisolvens TaxID=831 RepID=UPI000488CA84